MSEGLELECPHCGEQHRWDSKNPYRPFCSASCKNADFIAWANEKQTIPGNNLMDDLMSGDLSGDLEPDH
jgi:endogenous inhibitor of DNA gyrase (YacG/DUF329 family)